MSTNAQRWNRRAFLRIFGLLSLAGPAFLLIGCQNQKAQTSTGPVSQPPAPRTHVVQMVSDGQGHFFNPDRLRIQTGDRVKWVLQSGVHTSTAYHPQYFDKPLRIPEKAEPWHSGVLKVSGQSFEWKLDVEGVYNYYCTPHQSLGMVGIIVVGKPIDGPGMAPVPDMMEMEDMMTEGMLYEREKAKLEELISWAKTLNSP